MVELGGSLSKLAPALALMVTSQKVIRTRAFPVKSLVVV